MKYTFILKGEIPSKKNRYGVRRDKMGNPVMYQQKIVKKWTYDNQWRLKSMFKGDPLTCPVRLSADFYIKRDKDIDNMLNSLQDCLEGIVIENDKQITELGFCKKVLVEGKDQCQVVFNIEELIQNDDVQQSDEGSTKEHDEG